MEKEQPQRGRRFDLGEAYHWMQYFLGGQILRPYGGVEPYTTRLTPEDDPPTAPPATADRSSVVEQE